MGGHWTFLMTSSNVSNRLTLVKEGGGSAPGAETGARRGTDGARLVALRSEVTRECGATDSTMAEEP